MLCYFNGTLLISVLPPLLLAEFVLGILGNGLALWIFCFHLKPWKSSTVLLSNLALADFLLSVALPFRASYYISGINWMFGGTLCNICLFMLAMNRSGSTIFLMAIAVDRYLRVVHPHNSLNSLSVSKAACGAVALWLLTISMTAHVFTLQHTNSTKLKYCESFLIDTDLHHNLSWHKFEFIFSFYIPLLVILYCTIHIIIQLRKRQNAKIKKALCLITVVAVLFIICFLPSNITQLLIWVKVKTLQAVSAPESEVCPALENLTTTFYITISLTYLNSMLDPVVYYFSSPAFKNICRKALHLGKLPLEKRAPTRSACCDHKIQGIIEIDAALWMKFGLRVSFKDVM
ncbi:hydroxycarboxylic acid receptor 2-like isoform X1 [Centropristis striata]|uniref:hydroxycarboxylic acid receptor 2-like isoform X1 n=1 Tax=Centropristis striata TaxID=184440 RepID=UPI0027DF9940|nr:hydroxycarboxylic acid receptor 2-like isoform X1 [Centropristis striata]